MHTDKPVPMCQECQADLFASIATIIEDIVTTNTQETVEEAAMEIMNMLFDMDVIIDTADLEPVELTRN